MHEKNIFDACSIEDDQEEPKLHKIEFYWCEIFTPTPTPRFNCCKDIMFPNSIELNIRKKKKKKKYKLNLFDETRIWQISQTVAARPNEIINWTMESYIQIPYLPLYY